MKKLLLVASLVSLLVGPVVLVAQQIQNALPANLAGPGHPDWQGQTIQTGELSAASQKSAGLDPANILKPLSDDWTTYSGDMTGRRFSALKLANRANVKNLSLKWVSPITPGCGPNGTSAVGYPIIISGFGDGNANQCLSTRAGGGMIVYDGVIYNAVPLNVFAWDARDGTLLWHNYWKTRGGTTTGTRGPSMWRNLIYFAQHDDWLLALDSKTGKEVWRHEIAPFDQQYFSSIAAMPIGDNLIVGTGNDIDAPGFLKSLDPATGKFKWIWYVTPQKPGDPGLETWSSIDAARHGGGNPWIPGVYDPETKYYIFGTGNATPSYTGGRGEGDNLYTHSLVALNVETGKMAWYYQTSPHDTHDWDSTQTPILVDGTYNGKPRKLVLTATRNGFFFVLDRVTGEHLQTTKLGIANNWAPGLDEKGQPKRNPHKDAVIAGALVNNQVLNYPPATYSPETGLFYVHETNALRVSYLMEPDPRGSMGLGGILNGGNVNFGNNIIAIDYKSGKIVWRKPINGGSIGLLSTAGGLLFAANGNNVEAWDATTGKALWYTQIGALQSPPETFMLDGKQHFLFSAAGSLYMFVLN